MVAVGVALTVTAVAAEVALQPEAFVTSTVYEPAVVALYVAAVPTCVVPFNHLYEVPVLAVNSTDAPSQNEVAVVVAIVAVGGLDTVTVILVDVRTPLVLS